MIDPSLRTALSVSIAAVLALGFMLIRRSTMLSETEGLLEYERREATLAKDARKLEGARRQKLEQRVVNMEWDALRLNGIIEQEREKGVVMGRDLWESQKRASLAELDAAKMRVAVDSLTKEVRSCRAEIGRLMHQSHDRTLELNKALGEMARLRKFQARVEAQGWEAA